MCCICFEICQHMQCDNLQNTIRHPLSITITKQSKKYVTVTKDTKDVKSVLGLTRAQKHQNTTLGQKVKIESDS